jgi:CheY-like chemotaxis protein
MPIVDGLTSTKMIRSYEKSHPKEILSQRASSNGRVPIIAVSASLLEKDRQKYIDTGFDGWILKPIDFKRLSVLMEGIVDDNVREDCLYKTGEWENGGWFAIRQPDLFSALTKPDSESKVTTESPVGSYPSHGDDPFDDPISKEQDRLEGLEKSAPQDSSKPE